MTMTESLRDGCHGVRPCVRAVRVVGACAAGDGVARGGEDAGVGVGIGVVVVILGSYSLVAIIFAGDDERDGAVFPQHEVVATARTAEGNVGTRSVRLQNSEICKHFTDYFHSLCVLFCFSFAFTGRQKSVC